MPLLLQNGDYLLLQSGDKLLLQDETAGGGSAFPIFFQQASSAMNLLDIVKKGSTDRSVALKIIDSTTGLPETGVVFNTAGIDLWYRREGAVKVAITEATLADLTTAHADGGFLHVSDGTYRLDLPDAAFATGANYVDVGGTVTGMVVLGGRVRLVNYDPETDFSGNITTIKKNAFIATELAIGTVTSQTELILTSAPANDIANVMAIIYDNSASDAPVIAEGSYAGSTGTLTLTAVTSITITTSDTVTLVPVAATSDTVNLADGAITTAKIADGAITNAKLASNAGLATPTNITAGTITNVTNLTNAPTNGDLTATMKTSVTTAATAATPTAAAVTGAVGSVTGNVGGNVVGTVASVVGAVGSVTGNVGGNVAGSVGSVLGGINTSAGTITTLDALDTAQDSQHGTTRAAIPSAATIADAVWDEATSGHATAGSYGASVLIIGVAYLHTKAGGAETATATITRA